MADATLSARFYRLLLDLPCHPRPAHAVSDALALLADLTDARIAYVELCDEQGVARFSRAHGAIDRDLEVVRGAISRGIIGHALTSGETIATASALHDERFKDLGSVQQHQIAAVLCSPIGVGEGVVYLQGRHDARAFELQDRDDVVLFARQVAPMTPWLLDCEASRQANGQNPRGGKKNKGSSGERPRDRRRREREEGGTRERNVGIEEEHSMSQKGPAQGSSTGAR